LKLLVTTEAGYIGSNSDLYKGNKGYKAYVLNAFLPGRNIGFFIYVSLLGVRKNSSFGVLNQSQN